MYSYSNLALAFLQVSLLASSAFGSSFEVYDQCRETFEETSFLFDSRYEINFYKTNARKAQAQGHLASALEWSQQCLELNPDDLECHHIAAALCLKLSRVTESIDHHREVIRIEGPSAINLQKLMNAYLKARRPLEVLNAFELALDHSIVSQRLGRMVILAAAEIKLTALAMTRKWLQKRPNHSLILKLQVKLLAQLERYDEAMEIVSEQLASAPENTDFLDLKALILLEQRRFEESLTIANQVLNLNPRNLLAFTIKIEALFGLARFSEAHSILEDRAKQPAEFRFGRDGESYIFKMKFAALMAEGHYKEAFAFVTNHPVWRVDSKISLALQTEALLALDKNDEAVRSSLQSIERYPENALTLSRTAEALMGLEEVDAAHAALDQALKVTPSSLRAGVLKSLLWVQENNGRQALKVLDLARKRYPAESSAMEIYFLARMERFESARALITSWPHLGKYAELFTAVSAYVRLKSQEYDKALELSQALLASNPRHRLGQILRAQAFLGLKQFDQLSRHPIQQQQGRDARMESIFQNQEREALQHPSLSLALPHEVDDEIFFSLIRLVDRG